VSVAITATYAALLGLMLVVLAVRVIGTRRTKRVALGDGGHPALLGRIRAHGNFTEYVPMALLLMGFAEAQGTTAWLIHALGVALLAGRLLHAAAVSPVEQNLSLRVAGMSLTFTVILVAAAAILVLPLA
jgi:hypothetical protein